MNEGAKLIADSLLGLDFRVVILQNQTYPVQAPTIKTMCRAIRHFSQIGLPQGGLTLEALTQMPQTATHLIDGLACFFEEDVKERLAECTPAQLLRIMNDIVTLMSPSDFFACAALAVNTAAMAATPRQ